MISAVVLTKNEQNNIKGCLETLKWCNEILVIDDNSEDKTIEIAKKYGAKIFNRNLNNDFAAQRNFALQHAQGKLVLFVDADERITPALRQEIYNLQFTIYNGFFLKRKDFFGGRWLKYGETASVRLLRLVKKGSGEWVRKVHEIWSFDTAQDKTGELKNPILHYPHQTITEFLDSINYFSTLHCQVLYEKGIKTNLGQIICLPLAKFMQNYFVRLGFMDNVPGLIIALMMSFHSFLARAKLYLKWRQ